MTKAKSTLDNSVSTNLTTTVNQKQRTLTVRKGYYRYQDYQAFGTQSAISEILLKGKWLNDAGFVADSLVTIQVKRGKLVITIQ